MVEAQATARYVRTSAQKAGLVLDLIRGKAVPQALATLKFTRKAVARDVEKVLQSAVANARQKEGYGGDDERLVVAACYAGQGPSQKRVRPAPMGRAFRIVKRTTHLTVKVAEGQAAKPTRARKATKATRSTKATKATKATRAPKATKGKAAKAARA
jgi:large subunit ribosomal protein L22